MGIAGDWRICPSARPCKVEARWVRASSEGGPPLPNVVELAWDGEPTLPMILCSACYQINVKASIPSCSG
jgi:hypothetical protein